MFWLAGKRANSILIFAPKMNESVAWSATEEFAKYSELRKSEIIDSRQKCMLKLEKVLNFSSASILFLFRKEEEKIWKELKS